MGANDSDQENLGSPNNSIISTAVTSKPDCLTRRSSLHSVSQVSRTDTLMHQEERCSDFGAPQSTTCCAPTLSESEWLDDEACSLGRAFSHRGIETCRVGASCLSEVLRVAAALDAVTHRVEHIECALKEYLPRKEHTRGNSHILQQRENDNVFDNFSEMMIDARCECTNLSMLVNTSERRYSSLVAYVDEAIEMWQLSHSQIEKRVNSVEQASKELHASIPISLSSSGNQLSSGPCIEDNVEDRLNHLEKQHKQLPTCAVAVACSETTRTDTYECGTPHDVLLGMRLEWLDHNDETQGFVSNELRMNRGRQ